MTNQAVAEIDEISALTRTGPPAPPTLPVVEAVVNQALAAQRQIEDWSEARIDALLHALATVVADQAHALAVATVAETGMGNVRDKTLKNVRGAWVSEQKVKVDKGRISEYRVTMRVTFVLED